MLFARIVRSVGSTTSFRDNLQPKDVLDQPTRSSFLPQVDGTKWGHKTYDGLIAWTLLADDLLECEISCENPIDDWALWSALMGYLVRSPLREHITSIELQTKRVNEMTGKW